MKPAAVAGVLCSPVYSYVYGIKVFFSNFKQDYPWGR